MSEYILYPIIAVLLGSNGYLVYKNMSARRRLEYLEQIDPVAIEEQVKTNLTQSITDKIENKLQNRYEEKLQQQINLYDNKLKEQTNDYAEKISNITADVQRETEGRIQKQFIERFREKEEQYNKSINDINNQHNDFIQKINDEHKKAIKEAREDAIKKSKATRGGFTLEKMFPFFQSFPYDVNELEFFGNPIDFVCFTGIEDDNIQEIVFIELKKDTSQLNKRQRQIRNCVRAGRIKFTHINIDSETYQAKVVEETPFEHKKKSEYDLSTSEIDESLMG